MIAPMSGGWLNNFNTLAKVTKVDLLFKNSTDPEILFRALVHLFWIMRLHVPPL